MTAQRATYTLPRFDQRTPRAVIAILRTASKHGFKATVTDRLTTTIIEVK